MFTVNFSSTLKPTDEKSEIWFCAWEKATNQPNSKLEAKLEAELLVLCELCSSYTGHGADSSTQTHTSAPTLGMAGALKYIWDCNNILSNVLLEEWGKNRKKELQHSRICICIYDSSSQASQTWAREAGSEKN